MRHQHQRHQHRHDIHWSATPGWRKDQPASPEQVVPPQRDGAEEGPPGEAAYQTDFASG